MNGNRLAVKTDSSEVTALLMGGSSDLPPWCEVPHWPANRGSPEGPSSVGCGSVEQRDPGSDLQRHEGRRLFGLDPIGYRNGRPDYPEAVYEILVERCGLGPATRALEIGPGTGLVTQRLLGEGAHVTAIEPDPAMASYLRDVAASDDLEVVATSFEEAEVAHDSVRSGGGRHLLSLGRPGGGSVQTGTCAQAGRVGGSVVDSVPRSESVGRVQPGRREHPGAGDSRRL